ncbi:MAG: GTPase [Anaerolineales bacterium]
MPTNLPAEYYDADEKFRQATDPEERVELLEDLISTIPKHKGTDKLRADLRRKLSKMRAAASAKPKASRHDSPYHIDPEGAGQVVLCGPANAGKSSLLGAVSNAEPEVADYPFSTWGPTPGMMQIENIQVQLIDTPAIDRDFIEPEHVDLIRRSDVVLVVIDLQDFPFEQLSESAEFLAGHRIFPAADKPERPERGDVYPPWVVAVNKVDDENLDEDFDVFVSLLDRPWRLTRVSALAHRNLDELGWALYDALGIIRVYSKAPGREPDRSAPFVLPIGATVEDFAGRVHQDFLRELKAARLWGSAEFEGQQVARDYPLQEGDIVELRT